MSVRQDKNGKWIVEFGNRRLGTRYVTSVSSKIHGKYAKDIAEYIHDNQIRYSVHNWFKKVDDCYILYSYNYSTDEYFEILIDEDDFEKISKYHWGVYKNTTSDTYYSRSRAAANDHPEFNATDSKLHRFIMNITDPKVKIDHINGNGLDNRKKNLRVCPPKSCINERNRRINKNNKSGISGVHFSDSTNSYIATWYDDISGIQKRKSFGVNKYGGKEKAFEKAKLYRKLMENKYYFKEDED